MVSIIKLGDDLKIADYKTYKDGSPNIACLVIIVQEDGNKEIARTTTDKNGFFEFILAKSSLEVGLYQLQFYGSRTIPEFVPKGDWEKFEITSDLLYDFSSLEYNVNPSIFVSETRSRIDVNKNEIANIDISLNNIVPDVGNLTNIDIFYKLSSETTYKLLKNVPITDNDTNHVVRDEILLESKPSFYDFRAIFINNIGEAYEDNGVLYEAFALNVKLDGVSDVNEYVAVQDIEALNLTQSKTELVSDVIKLQWTDPKLLNKSLFPINTLDAFGREYVLEYETAQRRKDFAIFMFISDTNTEPADLNPGQIAMYGLPSFGQVQYAFKGATISDPNGLWVFCGKSASPTFETKLPRGKYVGFWIGFDTDKTISNVETETINY